MGELTDGIEDGDLRRYFSEFGFVVGAFRIPDKDGPKQNYGFVEFDAFDSTDIVVQQREHYIQGHRWDQERERSSCPAGSEWTWLCLS